MKNKYTIKLPDNIELPIKFNNVIDTYCMIGKLFKSGSYKYLVIYEDDKFFRKAINPKYKEVDEYTFIKGFWDDGFVINENNKEQFYVTKK